VKNLDPLTEVIHSIGSKPSLAYIASVFINPGDVTLMTTPVIRLQQPILIGTGVM